MTQDKCLSLESLQPGDLLGPNWVCPDPIAIFYLGRDSKGFYVFWDFRDKSTFSMEGKWLKENYQVEARIADAE